MKKAFVIGMVALAASFSANAVGTAAPKSLRESLVEYTKQIKESAFGKGGSASGLNAQQAKIARDKMINELNLPSGKANSLAISLSSDAGKSASRLEALATIVAAKKMATEVSKTDAAEGQSIDAAASAVAKVLSNASLTGANSSVAGSKHAVKLLETKELTETTEALVKMEGLSEVILTKFSKAERDSYTQIIERHDQLIEQGKNSTSEEAFVQAIMDVKKVDKAKALEVVRKLKECV